MKIDFGSFSKQDASKYLGDKVELSLLISKKFLEEITNDFPNDSIHRIEFEILTEGFLLFMIAARDGLLQEINKKLSSPLNENRVNLRNATFGNQLRSDPDPRFTQIWNLISNCIQQPSKVIITQSPQFWEWDRTNSWLWEINALRNKIAHRSINGQQIIPGSNGLVTKLIICELSIRPIIRLNNSTNTVPIPNPKPETIHEEKPKDYFEDCFKKFEKLKQDIRNLL